MAPRDKAPNTGATAVAVSSAANAAVAAWIFDANPCVYPVTPIPTLKTEVLSECSESGSVSDFGPGNVKFRNSGAADSGQLLLAYSSGEAKEAVRPLGCTPGLCASKQGRACGVTAVDLQQSSTAVLDVAGHFTR